MKEYGIVKRLPVGSIDNSVLDSFDLYTFDNNVDMLKILSEYAIYWNPTDFSDKNVFYKGFVYEYSNGTYKPKKLDDLNRPRILFTYDKTYNRYTDSIISDTDMYGLFVRTKGTYQGQFVGFLHPSNKAVEDNSDAKAYTTIDLGNGKSVSKVMIKKDDAKIILVNR